MISKCYFCKRKVNETRDFCYGCGHYICENCTRYETMVNFRKKHDVGDHAKMSTR